MGDFDGCRFVDDLSQFHQNGESAIARGQLRAWWAFAMVHGGFLLLSLLALWYRNHAWRFSNLSLSALWPFKRV